MAPISPQIAQDAFFNDTLAHNSARESFGRFLWATVQGIIYGNQNFIDRDKPILISIPRCAT